MIAPDLPQSLLGRKPVCFHQREYMITNLTWGFQVLVIIGGTREEADSRAEGLLGPKNGPGATTWLNDTFKGAVIWFRDEPCPGYAAHECLHVVAHIFRMVGLPFQEETEEAYAYLLQWLINEIMDESNANSMWSYVI